MGQADNQSIATPEPRVELPAIDRVAGSETAQVYRSWRSINDAILWAEQHLPHLSLEQIQAEFDALEVTHGKKAPVWVARVLRTEASVENRLLWTARAFHTGIK